MMRTRLLLRSRHTRRAVLVAIVPVVAFVVTLPLAASAGGEQPSAPSSGSSSAAEKKRLQAEFRQAWKLATESRTAGRMQEATAAGEKALGAVRRIIGEVDARVATLENWLAECYLEQEDFAAARRARQAALAISIKLRGAAHYRTIDARLALADVDLLSRLTPEQRRELSRAAQVDSQLEALDLKQDAQQALEPARQALSIRQRLLGPEHSDTAASFTSLGVVFDNLGDYAAARTNHEQALAIRRKVLGEDHPDTASSYNNLGVVLEEQADYRAARANLEQALKIRVKVLGNEHAQTADSYCNLGNVFDGLGDYKAARINYERALDIRRKVLGEEHLDTAAAWTNLGNVFQEQSDYAAARACYERALTIQHKVLKGDNPETAASYNNLGNVLLSLGDHQRARTNYERALEILRKMPGELHPDTATAYDNVGNALTRLGDDAAARTNYERALAIRRQVLGEEHPDTASSYNNLGLALLNLGDHAQARTTLERALALRRKVLGNDHPGTAGSYDNLAYALSQLGDYAAARANLEQALAIRRRLLGDEHPDTAAVYNNLGVVSRNLGDYAAARAHHERAVGIMQAFLARMFGALSERQQLALQTASARNLDNYLSIAGPARIEDGDSYAYVLRGKGAVTAEQFFTHLKRRQPELVPLFNEREEVSSRLAALNGALSKLSSATRDPNRHERPLKEIESQINELNERNEFLQRELAAKSRPFRQAQQAASLAPLDLQKVLPPKTALVDIVEYAHFSPSPAHKGRSTVEQRLLAFVVRPERPIKKIELGSADAIAERVSGWRRSAVEGRGPKGDAARFRDELRKLVWDRLEPQLDQVETILVSPDGALCQFPLAALPGSKPGHYLIEERNIAVIPVPRLLPQIVSGSGQASSDGPALAPLLVGDVDYDGDPPLIAAQEEAPKQSKTRGAVTRRADGWLGFQRLPGTKEEVEAIGGLFRRQFAGREPTLLSGAAATEQAVREKAPGHRWVHLATHGYFLPAPEEDLHQPTEDLSRTTNAPPSVDPRLLSGIALAGANRRLDDHPAPARASPTSDGQLTALEVEGLDLAGVDLIVLSACQTALGRAERGEGMLGLQRAFQLAGVRTSVTSLWSVDDRATRALMIEFYRNLWEKKLGKLESLRQAQLAMLKRYDPQQKRLRGLDTDLENDNLPDRGAPFYWAAFVLSGDWR